MTRRRSTGETVLGLALLVTFIAVWYCVIAQWPAISASPALDVSGPTLESGRGEKGDTIPFHPSEMVMVSPFFAPAPHAAPPTVIGHWP